MEFFICESCTRVLVLGYGWQALETDQQKRVPYPPPCLGVVEGVTKPSKLPKQQKATAEVSVLLNCGECQNEETDSNICTKCKNGKYFARKGVPAKSISEDKYGAYFCPHCSYRGMPFQKIVRDMICKGMVFIYCIRCGGRIRLTSTKDIQTAVKALQSQKSDGMSPKQLGEGFKETVERYKDIGGDSQNSKYPVTEYARKIGLCDFNCGDAER